MGEWIQNCHYRRKIQEVEKLLLFLYNLSGSRHSRSTGARQISYKNHFNGQSQSGNASFVIEETDWIDTVTKKITFSASLEMLHYLQNWQQWIVFVTTKDADWALTLLAHLYLVYVPPINMKYKTPTKAALYTKPSLKIYSVGLGELFDFTGGKYSSQFCIARTTNCFSYKKKISFSGILK